MVHGVVVTNNRWPVGLDKLLNQNFLGSPACFRTAFAVWRDFMALSTTNLMPVIGLNQISWSPLPCLSKKHPAFFRYFLWNEGRCYLLTLLPRLISHSGHWFIMIFFRLAGFFQQFLKYVYPAFSAPGFRLDVQRITDTLFDGLLSILF